MSEQIEAIKFYTDTHIAKAVAVQLRNRGIDVIRCEEVGLAKADDENHLEYAASERRVVITNDEDFLILHAEWSNKGKLHAGIMFCQAHLQGDGAIGVIVKACINYHSLIAQGVGTVEDDINNQIIYLS